MSGFRFSPNANSAHLIDWRPWAPETFALAQSQDRPVLLSISAAWCYWCHVMDETTYSDPDVQATIRQHFVAVRVDNDHRPDINSRYNVGGWPTTAFLTPHGGLIGGATYLPPDQFLAMMGELQDAYRADKPALYTQSRELLNHRRQQSRRVAAGPEPDAAQVDRVARVVAGAYDARHGGFGSEPKFTNPGILRLVLHLYRTTGQDFYGVMARQTLDRMADSPVYDAVEGGFFRHSAAADWSEPQREKLLEDNLQLIRLYLDAGIILGEPRYRQAAEQSIGLVMQQLYAGPGRGFRGSQGAHSDYFALNAAQRAAAAPPPTDEFCYAAGDALAVITLLEAAWKLGQPALADTALIILGRLDSAAETGQLSRVYPAESSDAAPSGETRNGVMPDSAEADSAESPYVRPLLVDWVWLLAALLQAHAATARPRFLERAIGVAAALVDRFFDETGGGFFDIEADEQAVGHLQIREKPLPENMTAAQALLRLHQMTRNADYRQLAEATLSAFSGVWREQGEFAAEFGLAVDLFSSPPLEITVEGDPAQADCRELLYAALRLNNPNLEIRTTESAAAAVAHICLDTLCLPPVSRPDALVEAAASIDNPPESPFQDILRVFPGS